MALSNVIKDLIDTYGKLVQIVEYKGLVDKYGLYGAYQAFDGQPYIFLERDQPEIDKQVILTEEFMHMLTSNGVILNQSQKKNRRQELTARRLTYKAAISVDDLIRCYKLGLQMPYEVSDELDLPEDFVKNAIEYFKTQLQNGGKYNGYTIKIGTTISFIKSTGNALAI